MRRCRRVWKQQRSLNEWLLEQNQRIVADYSHYHDLFQSSPIAYLVTDASGVILEANSAIARLLNVPQQYLEDKPLAVFVVKDDIQTFYTRLNQLSPTSEVRHWQISLCPWRGKPFEAELHVAIALHDFGFIKALRIGVYNLSLHGRALRGDSSGTLSKLNAAAGAASSGTLSQSQQAIALLALAPTSEEIRAEGRMPMSQLPQSLDGLRVLVVDDEADIREFITVVLESYGIGVRAVASAVAALEELERFCPDLLMSDIRMPGEDGYSLIRQVRALEAKQGGHTPAAAITAYLDEDREKALTAGYEAHLHKLAQPSEWIEMVAQLAGRTGQ
ncbi:MAG: response regulator [Chroococcidiopsidaceae cyanobacterium CP_BM_ER_R8_30]|nr:response regulator [Chroococcidiopsidaceae cyanobacterium CP_BM_ER_R8_30]